MDLVLSAVMDLAATFDSQLSRMRSDIADLNKIHPKYPELSRQLQQLIAVETNAGDKPPVEQENDTEEDLSENADWLTADQFKRMSTSPGAVFNFLYRQLKSPKHVYEAFTAGYYGCPPILDMEARGSGLRKSWRAGKCKTFHGLKNYLQGNSCAACGKPRHVHVGHDCKILEEAKCCPVHSFEGHSKSTKGGKREVEKGPFGEGEDGGG